MIDKIATFGQITKVDLSTGVVEGIAMDETPDSDGEIYDYDSSKPFVEKWSNQAAEVTKSTGQDVSYGNIRPQHNPKTAAGTICEPITFDDQKRQVRIKTRVIDKDSLEKCATGTYTGFSVKGPAVKKWRDGRHMRYTVDPIEISLVDLPCNKNARFTVVKGDGIEEEREFQSSEITEISGVQRLYGEGLQAFAERAVTVSKASAEPLKEKQMDKQEQVEKAAIDKMKAARKAHDAVAGCLGGYCDHENSEKCAEKVADAHKTVAAAFGGDTEAEKGDKKEKEKTEKKAEEKKEETEKAAGSEDKVAALETLVAKLTETVEKMNKVERPKAVVTGTVVTKEGDTGVEKAAKHTVDMKDPLHVEKALGAIFKGELEAVTL